MNLAKLPERVVTGAAIGVGVLLVGAYWVLLLSPAWGRFSEAGQQIRDVKVQLIHIDRAVQQEPLLRKEHERLASAIEELREALPLEEELPSVIELLTNLASQTGVKIQTIFPKRSFENIGLAGGQVSDVAELYKEIPIQIDGIASFHSLGGFLGRIEAQAYTMYLERLRIRSNPKEPRRHDIDLVVRVYFAASQAKGRVARAGIR